MTLSNEDRKRLSAVAIEQLNASAADDPYGLDFKLLYEEPGAETYQYYSLDSLADMEFLDFVAEPKHLDGLELDWSREKVISLVSGATELTDEEHWAWRIAYARLQLELTTEYVDTAVIVPLLDDDSGTGFIALFLWEGEKPELHGVYETTEEAEIDLRLVGVLFD